MPGHLLLLACFALAACGVRNSPHPAGEEKTNTLFTAFSERPRDLTDNDALSVPGSSSNDN